MTRKTNKGNSLPILTTGDVVLDRQVYGGDRLHPDSPGKIAPHLTETVGGARMLHAIIEACVGEEQAGFGLEVTEEALRQEDLTAFTLWQPCPGGTEKEKKDGRKSAAVWRVEQSLGYSLAGQKGFPFNKSAVLDKPCSVLVIDDADLGFRTHHGRGAWPAVLTGGTARHLKWVVLKMGRPLCEGDLWRNLCSKSPRATAIRKKLVVVVSADELRRAGAAISKGFSWERTLTELCRELGNHPTLNALLKNVSHLVVNFGHEASVWFGPDSGRARTSANTDSDAAITATLAAAARAHILYDPTVAEDGWRDCLADNDVKHPHPVYGHLNTIVGALAVHLYLMCDGTDDAAFKQGLQRGLTATRELLLLGHGKVTETRPAFPYKALAAIIHPDAATMNNGRTTDRPGQLTPVCGYSSVDCGHVKLDEKTLVTWTLASAREASGRPLYGLAHRVALVGDSALACIPHARFGKMISVDRTEMETLCSLRSMIKAYNKQSTQDKPLSLAAFGPPGAGKSFGIKQIAKEVIGKDVSILDFNLSQYNDASELIGAFHLVRDAALKGITPVVFWDEFDARDYHWLQYLLAPMQDGAFQENGHVHTLGKCIFVFAGATSWDFEHFGPAPMPCAKDADANHAINRRYKNNPELKKAEEAANADFRRKKGPDFMSRLDGIINVLGPNQRLLYDYERREWKQPDGTDITFPVRRAILLRSFLDAGKDPLSIDRDLLRAFLQTPRYQHGARSLEKIAKPLAQTRKPFQRAMLPPPQVLEQHVDTADDFDAVYHANRDFLIEENLQKMAAAIDENYNRHVDKNYTHLAQAAFVGEFKKKSVSGDPWQQWLAATNLAAARRLPDVLALVGLHLEKGAATPREVKQVSAYLSHHLDVLAKEEHDLWMAFHEANGWRQADPVCQAGLEKRKAEDESGNKKNKPLIDQKKIKPADTHGDEIRRLKKKERIHTLLVPYDDLDEKERGKDHDAIKNYPETVSLVGWKIVFA